MTSRDTVKLAAVRLRAASGEARQIRVSRHLSLADIASACNVTENTVWRWENGQRRPHGVPALAYADLLDALQEVA